MTLPDWGQDRPAFSARYGRGEGQSLGRGAWLSKRAMAPKSGAPPTTTPRPSSTNPKPNTESRTRAQNRGQRILQRHRWARIRLTPSGREVSHCLGLTRRAKSLSCVSDSALDWAPSVPGVSSPILRGSLEEIVGVRSANGFGWQHRCQRSIAGVFKHSCDRLGAAERCLDEGV